MIKRMTGPWMSRKAAGTYSWPSQMNEVHRVHADWRASTLSRFLFLFTVRTIVFVLCGSVRPDRIKKKTEKEQSLCAARASFLWGQSNSLTIHGLATEKKQRLLRVWVQRNETVISFLFLCESTLSLRTPARGTRNALRRSSRTRLSLSLSFPGQRTDIYWPG